MKNLFILFLFLLGTRVNALGMRPVNIQGILTKDLNYISASEIKDIHLTQGDIYQPSQKLSDNGSSSGGKFFENDGTDSGGLILSDESGYLQSVDFSQVKEVILKGNFKMSGNNILKVFAKDDGGTASGG